MRDRRRAPLPVPRGVRRARVPGDVLAAGRQTLAVIVDGERPSEVGADLDAGLSIAATAGAGAELKPPIADLHRVVVGDGARVLEAADAVQDLQRRWGAPRGRGIGGAMGEPRIVAGEKSREHALGIGKGPGLRQTEFGDEAILKGAKEAFDATFGLR